MTDIKFTDFDLLVESAPGGYRARVLNSPAGQASFEFQLPFSDLEIENYILRFSRATQRVRRMESPGMVRAKEFGGRLFTAVFQKSVLSCLHSSLDLASQRGEGLRIRLRVEAPDLAEIPWEYLYNSQLNRFLALSANSPIVRFIDLPESFRALEINPPLRVLVMISNPSDSIPLDVEREWRNLQAALSPLVENELVVLDRLETATLATLQSQLRRREYHIFHFIGHGGFDESVQDGVLLMESPSDGSQGLSHPVTGQYLGMLLHDETTLRLALLNSCEGARTALNDPFAGTAQSLIQQGVPAVIAMQFEISDRAAITFAREFYTALADNYPVDAAMSEARKAIFAQGNEVEWGTPVLYTRAPDGQIFDMARPKGGVTISDAGRVLADELKQHLLERQASGLEALENGQWEEAIRHFQAILKLRPEDRIAADGLREAQSQRQRTQEKSRLDELYTKAGTYAQAGNWSAVLQILETIQDLDPHYPDSEGWLNQARVALRPPQEPPAVASSPPVSPPQRRAFSLAPGIPTWSLFALFGIMAALLGWFYGIRDRDVIPPSVEPEIPVTGATATDTPPAPTATALIPTFTPRPPSQRPPTEVPVVVVPTESPVPATATLPPPSLTPRPTTATILWDLSHGPRLSSSEGMHYEPEGLYSNLVSLLGSNGVTVRSNRSPLVGLDLTPYQAVVISASSAYRESITLEEAALLARFVQQGGGLVILGEDPSFVNRIDEVARSFGLALAQNTIPGSPLENLNAHALTSGVQQIQFGVQGGSIQVNSPEAEILASHGGPALVVIDDQPGRVVVIGDSNLFDNRYLGNNRRFAINVFRWVTGLTD